MCNKIKVIVDDLKKQHGDKVTFTNISMTPASSKKAIQDAKLKGHGIIAKNAEGKIVKTVEGHSYGKEKVAKIVKTLLK